MLFIDEISGQMYEADEKKLMDIIKKAEETTNKLLEEYVGPVALRYFMDQIDKSINEINIDEETKRVLKRHPWCVDRVSDLKIHWGDKIKFKEKSFAGVPLMTIEYAPIYEDL